MDENILDVKNLNFCYGSSKILNDISFTVKRTDIMAVIGRNGVGKTTLLKCLMGVNKVTDGKIIFDSSNKRKSTYQLSKMGMAYVPQGRDIFPEFTVMENLRIGVLDLTETKIKQKLDQILNYFPALIPHLERMGGVLSGGQQQQLAIARALMTSPKLLLLDEPTEGIQPNVVDEIGDRLKQIHEELSLPIIVVEQNLGFVNRICSGFFCMQKGQIVSFGTIDELSKEIIDKYLSV